MHRFFAVSLIYLCASSATASVLECQFTERCSSIMSKCQNKPFNVVADFENGSIKILESGNVFSALLVQDQVMAFRSLIVANGAGAASMLSVHDDYSAAYTFHTGLIPVGVTWSSATGSCKDLN